MTKDDKKKRKSMVKLKLAVMELTMDDLGEHQFRWILTQINNFIRENKRPIEEGEEEDG